MSDKNVKSKLDEVVGRAIRDPKFRADLVKDPKAALKGEGLSDAELDAVTGGASGLSGPTSAQFLKNVGNVFSNKQVIDLNKAMWCTDKTCNEGG